MGANPKRAKSIWFSSAYAPFFSGAYARQGVNVSNYGDLKNYKVGVTGGTLEDLTLTEKAPNGTDIVRFGDNAANISAFVAGQPDVLITGNVVAEQLQSILDRGEVAIGVPENFPPFGSVGKDF